MIRYSGALLYTAQDAARNQWFIQQLQHYAESERIALRLCIAEEGSPQQLFPREQAPDFLINRSRLAEYSEYCEETLQIPVYNNTAVTAITNDKFRTYQFLHLQHGLPMAKTWRVEAGQSLPSLSLPFVCKPPDGHGGAGVRLIQNAAQLEQTAARPFLVQELMQPGRDLRIYIMGGAVYAAVLRTAAGKLCSNFSLGGNAALFQPDAEMLALTARVLAVLPLDFAGVDLLWTQQGTLVIGEIEDAVGCRMLYQLTERDPARDFTWMISKKLR